MDLDVYAAKSLVGRHKNQKKEFYVKQKLEALFFDDALVLPSISVEGFKHYLGGVVDKDNNYVKASAQERDEYFTLKNAYEPIEVVNSDKTVVYVGLMDNHWGHFILECVARLWYILDNPDVEVVYVAKNPLAKNQREFLCLLGLDLNKFNYIKRPTRFKKVIVPEVSTVLRRFYTDDFVRIFDKLAEAVEPEKYEKVYFTRTLFDERMRGEEDLEAYFRSLGYEIIAPETLPVKKQIAIMKGCKDFVSVSGTTAHNLIFANKGIKALTLVRSDYVNIAQIIINRMRKIKSDFVDVSLNFMPVEGSQGGPFIVGCTKYFIEYCRLKGLPTPKKSAVKQDDVGWFLYNWYLFYIERGVPLEIEGDKKEYFLKEVKRCEIIKKNYLLISRLCRFFTFFTWGNLRKSFNKLKKENMVLYKLVYKKKI